MHRGTVSSQNIYHLLCFLCLPTLKSVFWIWSDSSNRPAVNQELSTLFNELWTLDGNRMTPGTDYTLSVQVRSRTLTRTTLLSFFYRHMLLCLNRPGQSWVREPGQPCGARSCLTTAVLQREREQNEEHHHLLPYVPHSNRSSFLLLSLKV